MGSVDLVIQVESPGSVARGLQRIGRAGHQVGEPSKGVIFPKYRGDLLECAVVTRMMLDGEIEPTVIPRNPLDVLAQQLVATAADRKWPVDDLFNLVRRAENFADLGRDSFEATLGMLAGHYPGDEFAELRPRVVWDRTAGTVETRRDARTVAVISGGTIPDRGLFGVYLADDADAGKPGVPRTSARAARAAAGGWASSTRRWSTRRARARSSCSARARGASNRSPMTGCWSLRRLASRARSRSGRATAPAGPIELGRALGEFTRSITDEAAEGSRGRKRAEKRLQDEHELDELAARNLLDYLAEEAAATGVVPTDKTIVLQRFRDELGDWRVCLLTPFGARVHAPWALAIEARLREQLGLEVQPIWSDDGIVVRVPDDRRAGR